MLRRLIVKNLAIVEDLELELADGLTVITGETGAGKSILVDALALLVGGRASAELIRQGAARLTVAGEFDADGALRKVLEEAGLTGAGTVMLRREVSPDGRGRAYVEDEPAAVRTLARIGEQVVEIHGQNSERELAESSAPLELLDAYAGAQGEREATTVAARLWADVESQLAALKAAGRERTARMETLDFQIREIEEVSPEETEEEELLAERERLRHADRIRDAGQAALSALSEGEASASDRLGEAARALAELARIDPREKAHAEEAEDLKRRVADLAAAARDAAAQVEGNPSRLTGIETRLEKLSRLKRKYGGSVAEIQGLLERLKEEQGELSNMEDALERRQEETDAARDRYRQAAGELSKKRVAAAPRFSGSIQRELKLLEMERARFRVELIPLAEESPRPSGQETAHFLIAPNPGEPEKLVERVASGGELARLHLAIQSVAATRGRRGRTVVFDEVDSGIGGRTAQVVGKKLRALSARDQVLCVTHVPQIAALADHHFRAEKRQIAGRTVASIRLLEGPERVAEIARMLAGEKVPETALSHARALLEEARADR